MHSIYTRKITRRLTLIFTVVIFSGLMSCQTVSDSGMGKKVTSSAPIYYGTGSGDSAFMAMECAKRNAVRQAADDLLGLLAAFVHGAELDLLFDSIEDFGPYLLNDTQQTIDSRSNEEFYYHLGIRINLEALAAKLIANDILGGQIDGSLSAVYILNDQPPPDLSTGPAEYKAEAASYQNRPAENTAFQAVVPDVSAAELEVISRYLDNLTFMVYFNEQTCADPSLARSAVVSANSFLEKKGRDYVDLSQIETIIKEQSAVYEEETGNAVSIIQWIAHKVNADIYIELSLEVSGGIEGGRYSSSANVSLDCYEASTIEGRGVVAAQTNPPEYSLVSAEAARENALSSAVYKGMEAAVKEAEAHSAKAASTGFKFNLTMENTPDTKIIGDFEQKLESSVKSVKRTSFSHEESIFEVYLIGNIADLEDLIYDTAASIPGLEGLMLVMQRRNSIIFDTGM
ncbi:MAG: hypothetical protein JEZ04_12860 [Spirochaetales bacterium]|nr:hypothetical protein [Spirochaetales bacterium]